MNDEFEFLCDLVVNQPFERQQDLEVNPRQTALAALVEHYPDYPQTLALLRDRAEHDPDEKVREFAFQQIVKVWKDCSDTLPWIKTRAQSDESADVVNTALQELVKGWKDDPATLNWFKTYAQYSKSVVLRRAAVRELAKAWKDEFNVFEILCKCAVVDPFERQNDWEVNPRQTALEAIIEQYPDYSQTLGLLRDRAKNDPDEQVRQFAIDKLNNWSPN